MTEPRIELTADELDQVYETLNSMGQFIKRWEQTLAAADLRPKPQEYSKLAQKVMDTQRMVGAKVQSHSEATHPPGSGS